MKSGIKILLLLLITVSLSFALTYKVKRGDTLSEIAQKFGVTVEDIIEENNLRPPYTIYVGQKLKIPVGRKEYKYYRVRRGDTLSEIAQKFGVSVKDIIRANNLKRPYIIRVGQVLRIPVKTHKGKRTTGRKIDLSNCAVTHKVKPGDSIIKIAKKYHVWVKDIKRLNGLKNDRLQVGQVLCIKEKKRKKVAKKKRSNFVKIVEKRIVIHRVKSGENLSLIAKKYNTTVSEIIKLNRLKKPYIIRPGQKLKIPKKIVKYVERQKLVRKKVDISFIWPVDGNVIKNFVNNHTIRHLGIDIASDCDAPIKASEDGKVIYAGDSIKAYGNLIIIRHEKRLTSIYGHVGKILVRDGQYVKKGQIIGKTGKLNNSDTCGLYFEIRKNAEPINPLVFLEKK